MPATYRAGDSMAKKYTTFSDLTGQPVHDDNDVVTLAILEHPTLSTPSSSMPRAARSRVWKARPRTTCSWSSSPTAVTTANGWCSTSRTSRGSSRRVSRRKCWSLPSGTSQGPAQRDRAAEEPKRRGRPKSSGTGLVARVKGTDYTEMDNIGLVHRGRITDKEKELVAANFERAQENRRREDNPRSTWATRRMWRSTSCRLSLSDSQRRRRRLRKLTRARGQASRLCSRSSRRSSRPRKCSDAPSAS